MARIEFAKINKINEGCENGFKLDIESLEV